MSSYTVSASQTKTGASTAVVFENGWDTPDWRIFVFGKEFHVCSTTLKQQTVHFNGVANGKFDGVLLKSKNQKFKGDWYTQVKSNNTWTLTAECKDLTKEQAVFWAEDKNVEQEAFQNILCIFFEHKYSINDSKVLRAMADLAENFGCIEVVSRSIDCSAKTIPGFIAGLEKNACPALKAAWKLQCPVLFRESMVLVLGPWSKPQYHELEKTEPHLFNMADLEHMKLSRKVLNIHQATLQFSSRFHCNEDISLFRGPLKELLAGNSRETGVGKQILFPKHFRKLFALLKTKTNYEPENSLRCEILILLANNLIIDKDAIAGEGTYEDFFLCPEVLSECLPWVDKIDFPDYVPADSLPAKF